MRGLQKSKGVTWASDEYLCQVRLFLSEESPSQVASNAQDHLQAKTPWEHVPNGQASDENLPPGFEGTQSASASAWMINLSQIPLIKWKCPPKYVLDGSWRVVAGEESEEVKTQSKREISILEAIYPRNIPSDPEFANAETSSDHDQQQCPLIPIMSVEDEDVVPEIQNNDPASLNNIPMAPQQTPSATPSLDPNFLAAAQSALTMLMKNNNQANMIDSELLIKVLSDPKLIEQLGRNPGAFTQPASMNLHLSHVIRPELAAAPPPGGGFYSPLPNAAAAPPPLPPPIAPVKKDVNYYKSLIQQHGEERPDSSSSNSGGVHNNNSQQLAAVTSGFRQRDLKQKTTKPCMYFNTSRGCRNGANCTFQHDVSAQQRINGNNNPDKQNANKRMKLGREITGT